VKGLALGLLALAGAGFLPAREAAAIEFPGALPGRAEARLWNGEAWLGNRALQMRWRLSDGQVRPVQFENRLTGETVPLRDCEAFQVVTADGRRIPASAFAMPEKPIVRRLRADAHAARWAERSAGCEIAARLESAELGAEADWRLILRDEANAVREELTLRPTHGAIRLQSLRLVEWPAQAARVIGTVPGSSLALDHVFAACEHPEAQSMVSNQAISEVTLDLTVAPGQSFTLAAAFGAVPPGQMRRGFLYYVERERAHPYRPFLHYNSWYDICWGDRKIRQAECLDVIEQFGRELIRRRHVPLAAFVWDDGWDDPRTLWRPMQTNFPHGFSRILERARACHSTLGFWLSPFGGYGKPAQDRLAMGKAAGFETGPHGFSLAGTQYYERFLDTCRGFIDESGANFFKFDGLARSVQETEAMLRLTRALRARKPDLFVSITTGTWPSPYWLWWGDSTWRGGDDMGFHGPGSKREQWVTYRDLDGGHPLGRRRSWARTGLRLGILVPARGHPRAAQPVADSRHAGLGRRRSV